MLKALLVALAAGVAATAFAADPHPFSVHDMLAMDRISDPQVSPDGKLVAFTVSVTDLDANKRRSDLWLAAVDGSFARRLTTNPASDTQPRWSPDGAYLYFVSTRAESPQVWRLPLVESLKETLKSDRADLKNTGAREGGAISAAHFLHAFAKDTPWAHLDIAGPSHSAKERGYVPKAGTGFGVGTLVEFVRRWKA